MEDVCRLPFTVKQDLRDNYPYGLFAVPMSEVVRLQASSGTTGKMTVVGYTANDIATWADLAARALSIAGADRDDVLHVAYGYGLFTGGLGLHYGGERLGATVVPVSAGNTRRQVELAQDFGATVLCCTPSYSLLIAEQAAETGADLGRLRLGVFGAEPWSDEMRSEIEARLGVTALDIYGLSEVMGPAVAMECPYKRGLHLAEDHFIPEVVDPGTGNPVPDGDIGELALTCVTKEALPLLRYRTGDLTRLEQGRCECGRDDGTDEQAAGAHRRYADHTRGQRVPIAGRGGAAADRGAGTALRAAPGPGRGEDGRADGAGGGVGGAVGGLGCLFDCGPNIVGYAAEHAWPRMQRGGSRATGAAAQRGEGRAGGGQPADLALFRNPASSSAQDLPSAQTPVNGKAQN